MGLGLNRAWKGRCLVVCSLKHKVRSVSVQKEHVRCITRRAAGTGK